MDEYDRGYEMGKKDERFEWRMRLGQAVLTAIIIIGGHCFLDLGKKTPSPSRDVDNPEPVRVLLDENDPHKYNPNPSFHPDEYSRGCSFYSE
jgi:hypothetical protein